MCQEQSEQKYRSHLISIRSRMPPTSFTRSSKIKILDAILVQKLDCSFQINGSFSNPMITYLILICLDQSVYESADLKTAVFKSTSVIQGVLSKVIYTARLYTMAYLCHLAENNGVENTRMFIRQRLTCE